MLRNVALSLLLVGGVAACANDGGAGAGGGVTPPPAVRATLTELVVANVAEDECPGLSVDRRAFDDGLRRAGEAAAAGGMSAEEYRALTRSPKLSRWAYLYLFDRGLPRKYEVTERDSLFRNACLSLARETESGVGAGRYLRTL